MSKKSNFIDSVRASRGGHEFHEAWARFNDAIHWIGRPRLRIRKDLNPFRRPEALLRVV